MLNAFEKRLRHVRLRCAVNLLLEYMAWSLCLAAIVATLAVLIDRLFAVNLINPTICWALLIAVGATVLVFWLMNLPSKMQASLLLDDRLKLQERFSTSLALAACDDPFAQAACVEAHQAAKNIRLDRHFPIRPTKRWTYAGGIWALAITLALIMPQKDILGIFAKSKQQQKQQEQIQKAKENIKTKTEKVKSIVQRLDKPELANALSNIALTPPGAKPPEIKRQAIRKLGELSDQLKKMQTGTRLDAASIMNRMLKQLRSPANALSHEFSTALAQGNFKQASDLLKQMQEKLEKGKLSEEQKAALSKQMQALAKQLEQLAKKNEELEKELQKLGLNKKMAKLNQQQLKKELQKQGLSQQQIEQLLNKAAACRKASGNCSGLGMAMGACGMGSSGLSGEELGAVSEQLDQMEAIQQQLMLTQAALDQIAGACKGLGQGMCKGQGQGQGMGQGMGMGQGQGYGERPYDDSGKTATTRKKVESPTKKGPVIASWYFKSDQVKGESSREFKQVVGSARDAASEAIEENQIPRKYEDAVKDYFGRLEKSTE
ncbi:MAG: hypothetical protein ACYSWP_00720 [Planctomycetota bacterium]|jgi:hypothetical protein